MRRSSVIAFALIATSCSSEPAPREGEGGPHVAAATSATRATAVSTPLPRPLDRKTAVMRALAASPGLRAAAADVDAATGAREQAGYLPNPRLSATPGYSFIEDDNGLYAGNVELSWLVETAGRRGLRVDIATADEVAARARLAATRVALRVEVARAFDQALVADARLPLLEAQAAAVTSSVAAVARRVAGGDASVSALTLARKDLVEAELALAQGRADRLRARLRLLEVLSAGSSSAEDELVLAGDARRPCPPPPSVEALAAKAIELAPWLEARRAQVASLGSRVELEEARLFPNVEVTATYSRSIAGSNFLIGLSAELPLFDRNAGSIRRARADREARLADLERAELGARAEVERAHRALEAGRAALERYRVAVLPAAEREDAAAAKRLASGASGLEERSAAALDLARARLGELALVDAVNKACHDLEAASGVALDEDAPP